MPFINYLKVIYSTKIKRLNIIHICLFLLALVLPLYILKQISFPLVLDEAANQISMSYWRKYVTILPIYHLIYGWVHLFFHGNHIILRIFNLLIALALYIVGYMIMKKVLKIDSKKIAWLYTLFFLVFPVNLMSYFFVEENYLIGFGMMLYLLFFFQYKENSRIHDLLIADVIFVLLLGIKFMTELSLPILFILIVLIEKYVLKKKTFKWMDGVFLYVVPFIVFFAFYFLFIKFIAQYAFMDPFIYQFGRYHSIGIKPILGQLMLLTLYLSPYYMAIMLWITWFTLKEFKSLGNVRWLVVLFWIIVASFMKGAMFSGSYPKYLIICFYIGVLLICKHVIARNFKYSWNDNLILLGAYFYFFFSLKDPMLFNYPITFYLMNDPLLLSIFVRDILLKFIISLIPLAGLFFYKEKFKYFIILLLAFSLSTITYQAFNEYSLRLAYGERGLRSVIKWGEANVNKKDSSYAVKDLTYALFNVNNYNEGIFEYGENIESHLLFIQAKKPKYVMYRDYWIPRNKSIFFSQQLEDWGYTLRYQTGNFIVYDREPKP